MASPHAAAKRTAQKIGGLAERLEQHERSTGKSVGEHGEAKRKAEKIERLAGDLEEHERGSIREDRLKRKGLISQRAAKRRK